jgi:ketosteroid isomerase-like protein
MPIFNSKPTQLEKYINGWRTHDTEAILATLTHDCVVIESFGPIYHGHAWVSRWISAWLAENGRVINWTIQDLRSLGDVETAEWTFSYTWRGEEKSFEGTTIAKLHEGKISYLREYASTAPLYDWQGEWRPL